MQCSNVILHAALCPQHPPKSPSLLVGVSPRQRLHWLVWLREPMPHAAWFPIGERLSAFRLGAGLVGASYLYEPAVHLVFGLPVSVRQQQEKCENGHIC